MQPLAIIGVANRFPGSGNSPAEFWANLVNRKDCISEAKMDRWNARYYSSKGKVNVTLLKNLLSNKLINGNTNLICPPIPTFLSISTIKIYMLWLTIFYAPRKLQGLKIFFTCFSVHNPDRDILRV